MGEEEKASVKEWSFPGIRLRISAPEGTLFDASSYDMHLAGLFADKTDEWLEVVKTVEGLRVEIMPIMEREPGEYS